MSISLGVEVVRAAPGEAFTTAAETATRVLAILADNGAPDEAGDHLASLQVMPVANGDTRVNTEVTVHWVFD